jgi:transposase
MASSVTFSQVNPHAAAIDVGQQYVFVSTDGQHVHRYATFTADYQRLVAYLQDQGVERVCMEATGVYWMVLYQMLEEASLSVCLVNPKEVKQVKGRKTDVADCCWIWKVFSAGLVRQSYVPTGVLKELRLLVRERQDTIRQGGMYVNKMHRALELMNLKVGSVLSQVQGKSGLALIDAILGGERDARVLVGLCEPGVIKRKGPELVLALQGYYTPTMVFVLGNARQLWQACQNQLTLIDQQIQGLLDALSYERVPIELPRPPKSIRHHAPKLKNLSVQLGQIYGVDGESVPGLNAYTLLRLLGEVGHDLSRFGSVKQFVSWCQLAPRPHQSGKRRGSAAQKATSPAGAIFRQAAQSLLSSKDSAIGSFMRRLRSRIDSRTAVKAGARKLAQAFYWLLTKGHSYVESGELAYGQQQAAREQAYLKKLALRHHFQLVPLLTT